MKTFLKIIGVIVVILLICGAIIYFNKEKVGKLILPSISQMVDPFVLVKNDTAYIQVKLAAVNESFFKLSIDSIEYNVSLFDKKYIEEKKLVGLRMEPGSTDTIKLGLKIPVKTLIKDMKAARKVEDSADYSVNVIIQYSTILGKVKLPLSKAAKLRIPRPPDIQVVKIQYHKVRLKYIEAEVLLRVMNYNDINLSIRDIKYNLDVPDRAKLKGSYPSTLNVKPRGETFLTLPIKIEMKNIGKTLVDVLKNEDNYNYKLRLDAVINSPDPKVEPITVNIIYDGIMELKK